LYKILVVGHRSLGIPEMDLRVALGAQPKHPRTREAMQQCVGMQLGSKFGQM
jgi:hypothetical protein